LNVFDLINNEKIVLTKEMVNKIEEVIGWWNFKKLMI
jgi:large subunit ribosomal protein L4